MSLINQALKKEQQRRSLNLRDSPPDIPTYDSVNIGNGLSPTTRQSNRSLTLLLGFTGIGALLLILGGGFIYFGKTYLRQLNEAPMVSQAESGNALASGPIAIPVTSATEVLDEIIAETQEIEPETLEPETASEEPSVVSIAEEPADTEAAEEPGPEIQEVAEEPAPTGPVYDFKIQNLIDEMQVLGFRSAGPNSRLLMNGRVFKLHDIVDNERGLRFIGSDGENLVFEAADGYRYRKPL